MRLLRIIASIDPRGGGPMEGARRIDAELAALGHEVEVACLDRPGSAYLDDYPARVHALDHARPGYRYSRTLVPWLRANRSRFDAAIVNGLWQYHGLAAWRALAHTATPYFVFTHGMLDPWFKQAYPLKHLKKWAYWPWAEYRLLRDARAVLFTSEEERIRARESFWLYRCNERVVSYGTARPPSNGADLANKFLDNHPVLQGKRILLFLSRIHEKKGCDLLVEAFARVATNDPDLHLVIAGPDKTGLIPRLRQRASELGIDDRISWPGMLQGDAKWGAYNACEAFCLPSHQENFGIVVAEALACGAPVLTTNKVNIWREIEADGAGIVRDDTLEGIVDALQTWLSLPPKVREAMSSNARCCFEDRYQIRQVATHLACVIQEGLKERGATTP